MYTTQANVESRLGTALTAEQATYFSTVLDAGVDARINLLTDTMFGSTEIVDVYVEAPYESSTLIIPTMHSITALAYVGADGVETAIPVDEYFLYPRGDANKYAIMNIGGTWDYDDFGQFKITGQLGYAEVPDDITMVATEMATNAISGNINNYKSEKVGDWAVTYGDVQGLSADSRSILSAYKRLSRSI